MQSGSAVDTLSLFISLDIIQVYIFSAIYGHQKWRSLAECNNSFVIYSL